MNLKLSDVLCGFEVCRIRENKKLGGTLYEMVHKKTGAQLCYNDNGNENKLFSVAFKTTPEDSTGVFHILEHSVLCGSEKYPVKDPFLELMKSSMNTFLNAMTYPDKTVYPVSSRNEQDYLNLTSVYLDAVFAPKLLENPAIFMQEGCRIEKDENGEYSYNGVVLSEMKGAMSDIGSIMEQETAALLFEDSCYKYNSGGSPDEIISLTYENFVSTYKRFYHPSNARFFLDGSVPLEKTLSMIDEYLDRFEKKEIKTDIPLQLPHKNEKTAFYESEGETENRDNICFSKILGKYDELLKITGARVLCAILASTNESPLKKEIISASLAENLEIEISDGIYQPFITLSLRNCDSGKLDIIKAKIRETVEKLEIDEKDLVASLNKLEFDYRRTSEPQGLEHAISALDSWLYGGDPILFFELDKTYSELRSLIGSDFYKELLADIFSFDNMSTLILKPDENFSLKAEQKENEKLEGVLSGLGEEGISTLEDNLAMLEEWQCSPESPETLALLPSLDISCLDKEPRPFITNETSEGNVRILRHPVETNGISYLSLYFPMTDFTFEEYSKLALITDLLNELPTENYSVTALQRELKTYIGSLTYDTAVFADEGDTESCTPCLCVSAGVLNENIRKAAQLISEMLLTSDFSVKETIKNIVIQVAQENREYIVSSGHSVGAGAVRAAYSSKCAFKEAVSGISFMSTVGKLAESFDEEYESLVSVFKKAITFIGSDNMILSITSKDKINAQDIISAFPKGKKATEKVSLKSPLPEKTGVRIPAPVAYAVRGWHPLLSAVKPDGSLRVLSNIVSLACLWNEIRVLGGAYGAGMAGGNYDGLFCYTYRDPSPSRSLDVYGEIADFVTDFAKSGEDISSFIISTIASGNPLLTPDAEGLTADNFHLCGVNEEMRKKTYCEMVGTTSEDLLRWVGTLRDMSQKGAVCVIGGESLITECENLEIIDIK